MLGYLGGYEYFSFAMSSTKATMRGPTKDGVVKKVGLSGTGGTGAADNANNAVLVDECMDFAVKYRELIEGRQRSLAYAQRAKDSQDEVAEAAKAQAEMLAIREMEQKKARFEEVDAAMERKGKKPGRVSLRLTALKMMAAKSASERKR